MEGEEYLYTRYLATPLSGRTKFVSRLSDDQQEKLKSYVSGRIQQKNEQKTDFGSSDLFGYDDVVIEIDSDEGETAEERKDIFSATPTKRLSNHRVGSFDAAKYYEEHILRHLEPTSDHIKSYVLTPVCEENLKSTIRTTLLFSGDEPNEESVTFVSQHLLRMITALFTYVILKTEAIVSKDPKLQKLIENSRETTKVATYKEDQFLPLPHRNELPSLLRLKRKPGNGILVAVVETAFPSEVAKLNTFKRQSQGCVSSVARHYLQKHRKSNLHPNSKNSAPGFTLNSGFEMTNLLSRDSKRKKWREKRLDLRTRSMDADDYRKFSKSRESGFLSEKPALSRWLRCVFRTVALCAWCKEMFGHQTSHPPTPDQEHRRLSLQEFISLPEVQSHFDDGYQLPKNMIEIIGLILSDRVQLLVELAQFFSLQTAAGISDLPETLFENPPRPDRDQRILSISDYTKAVFHLESKSDILLFENSHRFLISDNHQQDIGQIPFYLKKAPNTPDEQQRKRKRTSEVPSVSQTSLQNMEKFLDAAVAKVDAPKQLQPFTVFAFHYMRDLENLDPESFPDAVQKVVEEFEELEADQVQENLEKCAVVMGKVYAVHKLFAFENYIKDILTRLPADKNFIEKATRLRSGESEGSEDSAEDDEDDDNEEDGEQTE